MSSLTLNVYHKEMDEDIGNFKRGQCNDLEHYAVPTNK